MIPTNVSQLAHDKFHAAISSRDLIYTETPSSICYDSKTNMNYWIILKPNFAVKPEFGDTPKDDDPLARDEPELTILKDLDGTNEFKLVLNKFPIMENHCLLTTNSFKDQTSKLTPSDLLTAYNLITLMNETHKYMVIYNSGPSSGSSQKHKHLQLIQLPEDFTPFQDKLPKGAISDSNVSFAHFTLPLSGNPHANTLHECYSSLLTMTQNYHSSTPLSYNFIMTKNWMCLIPRSSIKAKSIDIGFNSIAYAGLVLVKFKHMYDDLTSNPDLLDKLLLECGFPNPSK
ncbi:hypothetical protein KAFR_0D00250 [Kazachstania africana CBS 2517]|uniref:Uncharacterized protein n=1 Tax=Kazachstania africana (strain ATCC 22294 / BCRC 22015 / CBS 2517 / CECT 1963 / NBRC 1671 / NRRL Y-8276) TaxID=1071382 RepID=H2ATH1_KAZAF|nr:hypothetical protein KAFR_0D00250 [Kazachstania africana CBS 2517]CCF57671.1 hypothetical protein KAFR_0D00250 [Kazachstania africana CBS 2517]